jgi:AraC family transcriptional regulator, regulatory protein of adaptative response / methylated-DNA-[protein]-cysteine methyltransferase
VPQSDYERVERAILYIDEHFRRQPGLEEVARHVGLSPHHFQRLFRRWAGVSPKRFLQLVTAEHARHLLRAGQPALQTSLDLGLSSPSRLHDLMVRLYAVTPGEDAASGRGLTIRHGVHESPFGPALLASTERGVCALDFVPDGDAAAPLAAISARWPEARLAHDPAHAAATLARVFDGGAVPLHVQGTNFQARVWEALLRIPPGAATSYGRLAAAVGAPGAARAVGAAVGSNPVAYLIPCHRVLRASGALGGYRWGVPRKRAMLAWEAARAEGAASGG